MHTSGWLNIEMHAANSVFLLGLKGKRISNAPAVLRRACLVCRVLPVDGLVLGAVSLAKGAQVCCFAAGSVSVLLFQQPVLEAVV